MGFQCDKPHGDIYRGYGKADNGCPAEEGTVVELTSKYSKADLQCALRVIELQEKQAERQHQRTEAIAISEDLDECVKILRRHKQHVEVQSQFGGVKHLSDLTNWISQTANYFRCKADQLR